MASFLSEKKNEDVKRFKSISDAEVINYKSKIEINPFLSDSNVQPIRVVRIVRGTSPHPSLSEIPRSNATPFCK